MAFGYEFVTLDEAQKAERRQLLLLYPAIAQLSALIVFALFQAYFLLSWAVVRESGSGRPKSPSFRPRAGQGSFLRKIQHFLNLMNWWSKKPVIENWGTRGEWIMGLSWTVWLLFLSIHETGNDYLHLTKRFGIIGASQLPLQYMLAMRSPYSPVQLLTRLSHEELKASHQIMGKIVAFLFVLHASFYLNFFVEKGVLAKRVKEIDVIMGIVSIIMFSILSTTALDTIKKWNYRVFYLTHIMLAGSVITPLWFHVKFIRPYIIEVFVVILLHQIFRNASLRRYSGTINLIPGTDLIQIRIALIALNKELKWAPGQHVYLSRPTGVSPSFGWYESFVLRNQTNPFTIASLPAKDKQLLLIARTLDGNTKQIAQLARSLAAQNDAGDPSPSIPIALEGPYGASARLPELSSFDNVLLVAGGVGATFVMPVYRSIVEREYSGGGIPQVRFVWAMRKLSETQWAFPPQSDGNENESSSHNSAVEVYVTQPSGPDLQAETTGADIELAESDQLLSVEEQLEKPRRGMTVRTGRPDIRSIVDDTFSRSSGRIAVITCGPVRMTKELSDSVEHWVRNGLDVYWHNEAFGW